MRRFIGFAMLGSMFIFFIAFIINDISKEKQIPFSLAFAQFMGAYIAIIAFVFFAIKLIIGNDNDDNDQKNRTPGH